jgi:hypothetical protein
VEEEAKRRLVWDDDCGEDITIGARLYSLRYLQCKTCQEEAREKEEPTSCALIHKRDVRRSVEWRRRLVCMC